MSTSTITAPDVTTLESVPFNVADHLGGTVEVMLRLRAADAVYPPADAGNTAESLTDWLLEGEDTGRWVILHNGTVAGHIMIAEAHPYLTGALADFGHVSTSPLGVCEIGRFFTDPAHRRIGLGAELFTAACEAAEEAGYQPALAVLAGSTDARRFYADKGMQETGSFVGIHGRNFVFVRDPAATRTERFEAMRRGLVNLLG